MIFIFLFSGTKKILLPIHHTWGSCLIATLNTDGHLENFPKWKCFYGALNPKPVRLHSSSNIISFFCLQSFISLSKRLFRSRNTSSVCWISLAFEFDILFVFVMFCIFWYAHCNGKICLSNIRVCFPWNFELRKS